VAKDNDLAKLDNNEDKQLAILNRVRHANGTSGIHLVERRGLASWEQYKTGKGANFTNGD